MSRTSASGQVAAVSAVGTPRLDSLTGLRAVAAFAVFLTHAQGLFDGGPAGPFLRRISAQGPTGVSFFFVLSGFVLTWSSRPGDRPGAFYRRRFARIAPAYWCALCAAVLLELTVLRSGRGAAPAEDAIPSFFAVQAWWPDPDVYFGGNGPGWSISCEAFFYAVFPLLILWLAPRRVRLPWAAAGFVVLAFAVPLALHPTTWPTTASWAMAHLPVVRLAEFGLGMVLALAVRGGWRPPVSFGWAAALALAAYLAAGWVPLFVVPVVALLPFALLIATAAARDADGRRTPMGRPWLRRLGEWSFAFYLVHELVLRVTIPRAERLGHGLALSVATALVSLLLGVLAAVLLYRIVEVPLERRLRGAPPRPEMAAGELPGSSPPGPSPVAAVAATVPLPGGVEEGVR